jgi:uncharacterized membrane protein
MIRMRQIFLGVVAAALLCLPATPAFSQAASAAPNTSSQAPTAPPRSARIENPGVAREANAPDMVCFGYYPRWSVQLTNGEARYVGFNEADRYFDGDFYWIQEENAWEWRRPNESRPDGHYGLSATVEKTACKDPVQKTTNPFSAQVYLPEGDMVSGCCRKLKPGEAVIGHHGAPTSAVAPNPPPAAPKPAAPPANNTPPAGHPVDQY